MADTISLIERSYLMTKPIDEAVAQRAYELFLARGGSHGSDLQDWLDAERQLMAPIETPASRSRPAARRRPGRITASKKR
jgi:hypothetical protein